MDQTERRHYLIRSLLDEDPEFANVEIPDSEQEQKRLLRGLLNVRLPGRISDEFLKIQDDYLQEETLAKGITSLSDLKPVRDCIYLWQGDITTLKCDSECREFRLDRLLLPVPRMHR